MRSVSLATTERAADSGGEDDIGAARARSERESSDGGQQPQFEEGFTWKVVFGALFVVIIMLPGSIYFGLVVGQSLGGAAEWVTIVLFSEIARRSFIPLKRQELYCLFYMAQSLTTTGFGGLPGIAGGPFGNLIALQYLMQSPPMLNVASHLPGWVAPHPGAHAYVARSLFDTAWLVPIGILVLGQIFDRMQWMGLGYTLFRITSDVERLPFPLAPVAASGATALTEAGSKEDSWRWRVFSTGSIIGLVFGLFYVGIPIFTGVLLTKPLTIIPIPFFDFTQSTEHIIPTALVGYNGDLGSVLVGFILPWHIVLGQFLGSVLCQIALNPVLHHYGVFPDWVPGSPTIPSKVSLDFDFWMSFGIGVQLAIALIGLVSVAWMLLFSARNKQQIERASLANVNKQRGDFPWPLAIGAWLTAALGYIWLDHQIMPAFPVMIVAFYALVWTPLNSYISARMVGLTGQSVQFPFLNQGIVLKSGYTRPDIWFAPLPLNDYGPQAQRFREFELTGTKFTSIVKLEIFMLPLVLIFSFIYWSFIWHTTDVPSSQFPYAQNYWPLFAVQRAIWAQINAPGGATWVLHAVRPEYIGIGGGVALSLYGLFMVMKMPILFFYGFAGGMTNLPHNTIPTFVGSLLGRFYFAKRFGVERWNLYTPVLLAGFACGIGLVGMAAIALALISKTVNYLPF